MTKKQDEENKGKKQRVEIGESDRIETNKHKRTQKITESEHEQKEQEERRLQKSHVNTTLIREANMKQGQKLTVEHRHRRTNDK